MKYPCNNCIYQTSGSACHFSDKSWRDDKGKVHNYPGCKKWRAWWGERWQAVREMFGAVNVVEQIQQQAQEQNWEGK